jgi:hypothetical protein
MIDELIAFDEIGVDELVVVFESGADSPAVDDSMRRFQREVVEPYRLARREIDEAVRETYSM